MKTLLIGGARSGKSSLALRWAGELSRDVCVLVTGTESDPEMSERIAAHRRERPAHWRVKEEPVRLGEALRQIDAAWVLIDCLTLWISNCLWVAGGAPDPAAWRRERDEFLAALGERAGGTLIVTNEVGTGIVPDNAAARLFRDEQGWLNQAVAAVCDEVYWVTAGLPLRLKPPAPGAAQAPGPPR